MKKVMIKFAVFVVCAFVSSIVVSATGRDNSKSKIQRDTPFAFIPCECKGIGKVDIASITKIESVSKNIYDSKDLPYMKELKVVGLDISNIESVIFGIEIKASQKKTTSPVTHPASDGMVIISAKSKVDITKFIKIAEERNEGTKFEAIKIEERPAYILPVAENTIEAYMVQIDDKLIAVGTQKYLKKAVELINNKGRSILEDEQIMKLSNNTNMPDMLWAAAIIPDGFFFKMDKNTPNVKGGVISVNHLNDCLKISGIINCATKEDAQKVLLPFQVAASLIVIGSSDNTLKSENFSIKSDNAALYLDIKVTIKTLLEILQRIKSSNSRQLVNARQS